jgi:phosphoribosyl 1,2-cyclic phosphate phosphodiesterase
MNNLLIKILGCGASPGVPIPGCNCDVCLSSDKRNNRTRTSLYIIYKCFNILIDCGPDLRNQMLREKISHFDKVLLTHRHSDHVAGMDDLRTSFYNRSKEKIECFGNTEVIEACYNHNFQYLCQEIIEYKSGLVHYEHEKGDKPILARIVNHLDTIFIDDLKIICFEQEHGKIKSFGYLFPGFAYSTDLNELPEDSLNLLKFSNLDLWILPLTHFEGNDAHASFEKIKSLIQYVQPKRVVFTHMSHRVDYEKNEQLPANCEFGYDGMELKVSKF